MGCDGLSASHLVGDREALPWGGGWGGGPDPKVCEEQPQRTAFCGEELFIISFPNPLFLSSQCSCEQCKHYL
ncbi:unnamed protein product [Arctogadus glacialis]